MGGRRTEVPLIFARLKGDEKAERQDVLKVAGGEGVCNNREKRGEE